MAGPGVSVRFNAPAYTATWTFDPTSDRYTLSQSGKPFVTQSGTVIKADNVAVVITEVKILDEVGRKEIRTIGTGDAIVFQDGKEIDGTWKKPSATDRLQFYDAQGKVIPMNAGVTWIDVAEGKDYVTINPAK